MELGRDSDTGGQVKFISNGIQKTAVILNFGPVQLLGEMAKGFSLFVFVGEVCS